MSVLRVTIALVLVLLAGAASSARVESFPIPGVPGVPGIDPRQAAIKAAAKQLTPWVDANQPIIRDWSNLYQTVPVLPGKPWAPSKDPGAWQRLRDNLRGQLAHSTTGIVHLPPGDYAIPVRVYCTSWYNGNIHRGVAGHRGIWDLGPLRGSRADILAAVYARASFTDLSFDDIQTLSWALQAGLRFDDFPRRSKDLVNSLIPEFKNRLVGSFTDQMQTQWNQIASHIPNVPSFDSSVGSMGDVGQTFLSFKGAREEMAADANNFSALEHAFAPPGGQDDPNAPDPPWSVVGPHVYVRLLTEGYLGSKGSFEVRVVSSTVSGPGPKVVALAPAIGERSNAVANEPGTMRGDDGVPFTPNINYPRHNDWQPLTLSGINQP